MPLEQPLGDDRLLDLVRPFANHHQRRVTVETLNFVLGRVAVASKDAHGLLGAALTGLGGVELCHAGLDVGTLARILLLGGGEDQVLRGLDASRHVGELLLDQLVMTNRLAEGGALLGVLERQFECAQRDAETTRGNVDAPRLDARHHLVEALADHLFAAQDGRDGYAELFEGEFDRFDAVIAELAERRRDGQPVLLGDEGLLLDEQCRHARVPWIRIGVGLDEQRDQGGAIAVGDPHLVAVDDELVAFASGDRADRLDVRARVGLGHREARPDLADGESWQIVLLLLVGAVRRDHAADDVLAVDDAGHGHPATGQLGNCKGVRDEVEPEPAVFGRNAHPEGAHVAQPFDDLGWKLVARLEFFGDRDDLAVDEFTNRLEDLTLLWRDVESVKCADALLEWHVPAFP